MPEEPAKTRIDAKAQEAINDTDQLLATYREQQELQLGLQQIKDLLLEIQGDTHSP